jgi:ABC-type uncharacterized transport system substrate-binding protein
MADSVAPTLAPTLPVSLPPARSISVSLLLGFCLLIVSLLAQADQQSILILSSGNAKVYQQVSSSIRSSLKKLCGTPTGSDCREYRIVESTLGADDSSRRESTLPWNLVVTIGVKAAENARRLHEPAAKLYTLIPKASTEALGLDDADNNASAVYLDQPIMRQLNLVKLAKEGDVRMGALLGPTTEHLRPLIEMATKSLNITAHIESVTTSEEIGPALRRTLDESDILLALPDPLIYNQKTIFNILLSSYHNRIPVIGFSASYVKAGAMLAVYSKPDDIGMQIAEVVKNYLVGEGGLPRPVFPKYFSVESNRSVSRSLGIKLPGNRQLADHLRSLEGR